MIVRWQLFLELWMRNSIALFLFVPTLMVFRCFHNRRRIAVTWWLNLFWVENVGRQEDMHARGTDEWMDICGQLQTYTVSTQHGHRLAAPIKVNRWDMRKIDFISPDSSRYRWDMLEVFLSTQNAQIRWTRSTWWMVIKNEYLQTTPLWNTNNLYYSNWSNQGVHQKSNSTLYGNGVFPINLKFTSFVSMAPLSISTLYP